MFGVFNEMNEIKKEELFFTFDVCMSFSISLTASDPSGDQQYFLKKNSKRSVHLIH